MKTQPIDRAIRDAAQLLVSSQADLLKFDRYRTDWRNGLYCGRRMSAIYILRGHCREFGQPGRNRVAAAVRFWCGYFHDDFQTKQPNHS